jgi:hypothetical protein
VPRRKKLPPDIDPKRPHGVAPRGRKHQCPHCLGTTHAPKGVPLEQAIANHEMTCPAIHRIQPKKKGT